MKVIFISSGNSTFGITPIIKNQAESLIKEGIEVDYYSIKGKGIKGYLKNVKPLKQYIKSNNYDVVHAHYSLTAFVASLAGAKPLVVSLMGSDVKAAAWFKFIIKLFGFLFSWKAIIVKSQDMYDDLGIKHAKIIPNGVDIEKFKPINKIECQNKLNWDLTKKHILFPANPNRPEKNFPLAKKSVELIDDLSIELHYFDNVPNEETPIWYNAADVILMTSLWEGSPNAIKEAIACCRPIVTTKVGDVAYLLNSLDGTFVRGHDEMSISNALQKAINYKHTAGVNQISKLKLSSELVAKQLIDIYDSNIK